MNVKIQAIVGKNIRKFRLADSLTLEELAFRAQLHPNYLGDLERGKRNPSLVNLIKIANGLKKPLPDLLSGASGTDVPAASATREKTAVYFSPGEDKDLLSLIKTLRNSSPKNRKRVIQIAKSLTAQFKKD